MLLKKPLTIFETQESKQSIVVNQSNLLQKHLAQVSANCLLTYYTTPLCKSLFYTQNFSDPISAVRKMLWPRMALPPKDANPLCYLLSRIHLHEIKEQFNITIFYTESPYTASCVEHESQLEICKKVYYISLLKT